MDHTLRLAGTVDQPKPASTEQALPAQSVAGVPSQMGALPQLPYTYYPLVPNTDGRVAPPRPLYSQGGRYFTIVGENEPLPPPVLPPPVGPMGPPFRSFGGMPCFAGGAPPTPQSPLAPGALAAYGYSAMNSCSGGQSGIRGGPTASFLSYNPLNPATPISELERFGQLVNVPGRAREEGLSPKAIRKLSHNAVEARCLPLSLLHHLVALLCQPSPCIPAIPAFRSALRDAGTAA